MLRVHGRRSRVEERHESERNASKMPDNRRKAVQTRVFGTFDSLLRVLFARLCSLEMPCAGKHRLRDVSKHESDQKGSTMSEKREI